MTIEEAIAYFDARRNYNPHNGNSEAERLALAALRAQQEAEKNEPLTMDELREMGGEPYWHVGLQEDSPPPHWSILDAHFAQHIEDYEYGERWLAFRRKPEEG